MIEMIPGEAPEEIEYEDCIERLHNLGKSPPWLLAVTASIMGGGIFYTRKRPKKLNSISFVQSENEPAAPNLPLFSHHLSSPLHNRTKIENSHSSHRSFACLTEQEQIITKIINILDQHSGFGLLSGGWVGHLRKLEEEIDDVPALNFLWTVFSNRDLREKVQRIFDDAWKIGHQQGFLAGIDKGMRRYFPSQLELDLDSWARSLRTTKAAVKPFIQSSDWKGLVVHLLSRK